MLVLLLLDLLADVAGGLNCLLSFSVCDACDQLARHLDHLLGFDQHLWLLLDLELLFLVLLMLLFVLLIRGLYNLLALLLHNQRVDDSLLND